MRIYADEYKKTHKAQNLYDFSPDSCDLFAIEKQEEMKTFEQNSVTLIQRHNTRLSFSHWVTALLSSYTWNSLKFLNYMPWA